MLGNAHSVLALLLGNFSLVILSFALFLFAIFRNYLFGTSAISQAPLNERIEGNILACFCLLRWI